MLKLLADEHISLKFIKALRQREPAVDVLRVHDVGHRTEADPVILEWAAANDRVLFTFDRETMPGFAYERLIAGEPMAGLVVIDPALPLAKQVEELLMVAGCMDSDEIRSLPLFIPLR